MELPLAATGGSGDRLATPAPPVGQAAQDWAAQ